MDDTCTTCNNNPCTCKNAEMKEHSSNCCESNDKSRESGTCDGKDCSCDCAK